jgi:hypothetical protein
VKSHINADVGQEVVGFKMTQNEDWVSIKNVPDHVLVKKLKSEEERKVKGKKKGKGKR